MAPHIPATESPVSVGDEVAVFGTLSFINQVGGSESIPGNGMICRVDRTWWDYETGWHIAGTLRDADGIEIARLQGFSEYDAEHYRREFPAQPHLAEAAAKAAAEFDPSKVFFTDADLVPSPTPGA